MSDLIYRVGVSTEEVNEEDLSKSGLKFKTVSPREQIISSAKSVLGKSYKRGASVLRDAPEAFDCSSLTAWVAVEAGLAIPRISIDQFMYSDRVNKEDLKAGDLVFANTGEIIHTEGSYYSQVLGKDVGESPIRTETLEYMPGTKVPEGVDHVGVYVGDNKVIHSSIKTGGVVEEDLSESNQFKNIVGYGRIVKNEDKRYVVEVPVDRVDLRTKENLINESKK
jgi:cell wall-associated NlpC family hydrolase